MSTSWGWCGVPLWLVDFFSLAGCFMVSQIVGRVVVLEFYYIVQFVSLEDGLYVA